MSDKTNIEWTDATWNIITGCSVLSAGCKNCYAMKLAGSRLQHHHSRAGLTRMTAAGPVWTGEVRFNPDWLDQPVTWKRPRRIFVAAHSDIGHDGVSDEWLDAIFGVMAVAHWHTFQVLTKRPARLLRYLQQDRRAEWASWAVRWGSRDPDVLHDSIAEGLRVLPHVHIGVTTEDQAAANERVPLLLQIPAAVRFISAEPLLGPIDLTRIDTSGDTEIYPLRGTTECVDGEGAPAPDLPAVGWVIVGGESSTRARPMHPDWARSLRDQCAAVGVPFLFKQWGSWAPADPIPGIRFGDELRRGTVLHLHAPGNPHGFFRRGDAYVRRVTKGAAGRLLDGRAHDEFPQSSGTTGGA